MNVILIAVIILGVVGLVASIMLYAASKKFAVVEDERIGQVAEVLPQANCGGWNFAIMKCHRECRFCRCLRESGRRRFARRQVMPRRRTTGYGKSSRNFGACGYGQYPESRRYALQRDLCQSSACGGLRRSA